MELLFNYLNKNPYQCYCLKRKRGVSDVINLYHQKMKFFYRYNKNKYEQSNKEFLSYLLAISLLYYFNWIYSFFFFI